MVEHTPIGFVAGRIPSVRDPWESAWHAASSALETREVKLIVSNQGGSTWYLAAPARDFASYPDAGSSLAAALPGMPGHMGSGAYIAQAADRQTGVVLLENDGMLRVFVGEREEAVEFSKQYKARIVDAGATAPVEWEGYHQALERLSRKTTKLAINVGVFAAIPIFALWIGLSAFSSWSNVRIDKAQSDLDRGVQTMITTVNANLDSPVRHHLMEIQTLANRVAKARPLACTTSPCQMPSIPIYQVKNGQTYWELDLPQWVTPGFYSDLGAGDVTPLPDGNIRLTKGRPL